MNASLTLPVIAPVGPVFPSRAAIHGRAAAEVAAPFAAGASLRGATRVENEDDLLIDDELGLSIVADGYGGRVSGELRARIVTEAIHDHLVETARPSSVWSGLGGGNRTRNLVGRLRLAIEVASARLLEATRSSATEDRGGSTVAVLLVDGSRAVVAHVGDSRVYRLRGGRLELLTEDHTLTADLVRSGRLTREEARKSPLRCSLTRAIGRAGALEVEISEVEAQPGDRFLLATDGLVDAIDDVLLERLLGRVSANELVEVARVRGADDDATALVVAFE